MTSFFKKLAYLFITVSVVLFTLTGTSYAQSVQNLRSFHNNLKTRIVVDTSDRPNLSTSLSANKAVFSMRIRNVANSKTAPTSVRVSTQSCIQAVSKRLDNNDVRYLFSLSGCKTPKVFTLAPSKDSSSYRIVLDFENGSDANTSSNSRANTVATTHKSVSKVVNGIDTSKPLSQLERDLFIQYSTASKDGFRTMTPANATIYNQKLKKLRSDYNNAKTLYDERVVAANTAASSSVKTKAPVNLVAKNPKATGQDTDDELVGEASAPPVPVKATPISRPFIIAIDPGHGGKDPGAIGRRGVREKNVTLAIAKALTNYINSNRQFRGTLTRSSDVFIDLDRRSEIARRRKADLLISIHADSVASGSSTARGASVLVLSENRATRENGKILRNNKQKQLIGGAGEVMDQSVGNPYLATAILDMSSTNSRSEGNLLAQEILSSLKAFTHVRKTTPISASLAVLKSPDIPSLLIETGYLSNRYEEIQLNQPNYQKQIAYRIYLGIKSYYQKYPAQKLKSRQDSYARTKAVTGKKSVTVKKGDSLSLIAKRNKTTVKALTELNSLKTQKVFVGQVLYLP